MNEYLAMLLDSGTLADHWPDILVATLITAMGGLFSIVAWFLKRDIAGMDKRHERAENKFEEQSKQLGDLNTRITVLERTERRTN